MLSHYLKVFIHNLSRQKVITLINIAGLAVGMAVFMLIGLYVKEEYDHEGRWNNADRIARTVTTLKFNASSAFVIPSGSSRELALLQQYFSQAIESGTRTYTTGLHLTVNEENVEGTVNYVDATFLQLFDLQEISGNLADTLAAPGRIALEEERAQTLFQGEALGKTLTLNMEGGIARDFEVTAIYRMPQGKGILEFTNITLLKEELLPELIGTEDDWLSGSSVNTYLLLRSPKDIDAINTGVVDMVQQHVRVPWMYRADAPVSDYFSLHLQPIRDIHFNPLMNEEGASRLAVNGFALAGVLVLLVALTNFVILSVAKSTDRVREVGVRKANGAHGVQLQGQFLMESLLQVVLAFGIGLALFEVLKPVFESLMQTELLTRLWSASALLWGALLIAGVTLLGGMYPAFVLSSVNPERALKPGGGTASGNVRLRTILVAFQFTIAVALVIATLVIYRQLAFVKSRDAGFDASNVVSVGLFNESQRERGTALFNEISRLEGVELVTPASRMANSMQGTMQVTSLSRERGSGQSAELYAYNVGHHFFSLYDMRVLAGRPFMTDRDPIVNRQDYSVEESGPFIVKVVLNESAIRDLGFDSVQAAIGQPLYAEFRNDEGEMDFSQHEIIGVVADSQFDSLRSKPLSEMYRLGGTDNMLLSFQVSDAVLDTVKAEVEAVWSRVVGIGSPIISFGRDNLANEFRQEENEARMLTGFSLLAILVSCLGLYGLVAFDTVRRTKEIGVRKVLGGGHRNIQTLFLRQYFWPMLIANLIAWPVAVWAMQQWLQQFPYQIPQWAFLTACLLSGLLVTLVAGSTLGLTVSRAFRTRPSRALRYE